jgi:hypothetical protein
MYIGRQGYSIWSKEINLDLWLNPRHLMFSRDATI